jgi:formylglycine-generating enzyme required for sulfatase activity
MIQVDCSKCGLRILVPPTVQGRQGICFKCGAPLHVPGAETGVSRDALDYRAGDRVSDRYVIEERIGSGGMGMVYRAQDTLVGDMVALKFMRPRLLQTERGQQLFLREAQIARRLRHENIVAVHDVSWTAEGILYISMEYAAGQSLRAFLKRHREERKLISVRLAVNYTAVILAALAYAHTMVVHRDIKPENVMLLPGEKVKVLDFGLAKAVQEEIFEQKQQETGKKRIIGTLAYAAPEQKMHRVVDLRADIYAAGLVLHELLTLRTPAEPCAGVADVRNDVSPSLLEILKRALQEEKEQRWQSAGEFRTALLNAFDESYRRKLVTPGAERVDGRRVSTEDMVYLEGGHFLMGNNQVREEAPEAEVFVAPFWMDIYPVTVRQYEEYMRATGAQEPRFWRDPNCNGPDQPVVGVSWEEALAYAKWAGKTLPSEEQWEFAARGRENRAWPWGSLPPDTTLCNYRDYLGMPSIVTMHEDGRTPDGIYDMAGNVFEWTRDPFAAYELIRAGREISIPRIAVRGGCWNSPADALRCTARKGLFPETRENTAGFRCVLSAT